jgi:hypothetical protein
MITTCTMLLRPSDHIYDSEHVLFFFRLLED